MSGGAAAALVIANAIKASGTIVEVGPDEFRALVDSAGDALVVHAEGGVFSTSYQYLMGFRGLAFYTRSRSPVRLPEGTGMVRAKKIWIPG